jgi:hypothetical protein
MRSLVSINTSDLDRFLARPERLLKKSLELQIAIATFPETPRHLLEILVDSFHPEVAEAARLHVNYGGELTENWQDAIDEQLKSRYLGQNDRLAVELLKFAPVPDYFLSEYVPPEYLIQGLSNPYLPLRDRLRLLERLAKEPALEPRLVAAESPETPLPILEQLIGDLELSIRLAVNNNPNFSPEFLRFLQEEEEAKNWDTNAERLALLSNSCWDRIRLLVAQNPSASQETLLNLAEDRVSKIQLAVAKNPVTPATVLSVLANHADNKIQAAVVIHPNVTEEILHSLFPTKQGAIRSRPDLPASILERIFNEAAPAENSFYQMNRGELLNFFLKQPNTPTWILAEAAKIDIEKLT